MNRPLERGRSRRRLRIRFIELENRVAEIAQSTPGITREAARQAEVRLMKRLKKHMLERLGDLGQVRIGPK